MHAVFVRAVFVWCVCVCVGVVGFVAVGGV